MCDIPKGDFGDLEVPLLVAFSGSYTVVHKNGYASFSGVHIYRKFYSEEKERSNGVLAIVVTKPAAQPFISLASMLSVSMLALMSECLIASLD